MFIVFTAEFMNLFYRYLSVGRPTGCSLPFYCYSI